MTAASPSDLMGIDDDDFGPPSPGFLGQGEDLREVFLPVVQNLVNALGGFEQMPDTDGKVSVVYRPGDSVLAVLKDLKKLWRKDDTDDERTVARCMFQTGLMGQLVALVNECADRGEWGRRVALMACDLIAALTWPIDVAQELKEMDDEGPVVTDYASLLRAQVEYKATLLHGNTLRSLLSLLLPCFAKQRREQKEERVISLGLHIVRNLLAIKDVVADDRAFGEKEELSTLQSSLIVQLGELTYLELLVTLASGANRSEFNAFNTTVLDILHLIFRSVKPSDLGKDPARAPIEQLAKLLDTEERKQSLASRHKPTRHSRFGTTITVRSGPQKVILHRQEAVSADAGEILDAAKRKRFPRAKKTDELTLNTSLSPEAMKALQKFGREFIVSAFNDFMESILSDIRMERSKVRPADSLRALIVSRFCIEYLMVLRQKEFTKAKLRAKTSPEGAEAPSALVDRELSLGYVNELVEGTAVRWVVSRMRVAMEEKPPAWTELQASIDCFTQILLLIDAMVQSSDDEDSKAAESLQHQLYYNGDILDASIEVVSRYKDQSIGYLHSVVHFAYVLLRMLEKYSKSKSFMFVRKRRAAPRKIRSATAKEEAPIPEEYAGDEGEEGAIVDDETPSYQEHAFKFTAFEKETVTNTLVACLERYRSFSDPEQVRRVVGLIHRQVVKCQAEGLYFRVSSLLLFRRILDDQAALLKCEGSADLLKLINFVLRKFFKHVAEDPFLIVEAFTPKSRSQWKADPLNRSDEDVDGMAGQAGRIREKVEFVKKRNLPWSKKIEVVVGMLLQADHRPWIDWVVEVLEVALAERQAIVLATDRDGLMGDDGDDDGELLARAFDAPSKEAKAKFVNYNLAVDTEERGAAINDPHLRMLLGLLQFTAVDEDETERWFLPLTAMPGAIHDQVGALKSLLDNPPEPAAEWKSFVRKAPRRKRRATTPLADAEVEAKPKRRNKQAEIQVIKSAAFIDSSGSELDAEKDKEFFAREQRLREEMDSLADANGYAMPHEKTKVIGGKRKRKTKKAPTASPDAGTGDEDEDDGPTPEEARVEIEIEEEEEEETLEADDEDDEAPVTHSPRKATESPSEDNDSDEDSRPARRRRTTQRVAVESDSDGAGEE